MLSVSAVSFFLAAAMPRHTVRVHSPMTICLGDRFQRLILEFLPLRLPGVAEPILSPAMLGVALIMTGITGLLFGIIPALRGTAGEAAADLKAGARTSASLRGSRLRSALVVAQVAVSVVLLIGSGLLIRSFILLTSVNPGFDSRNLLTAEVRLPAAEYPPGEKRVHFFSSLLEKIRAIPGVRAVGIINQLPIRDPYNNTYVYAASRPPIDPGDRKTAFQRTVFPGYFAAMGIPLMAGRDVQDTDREGMPPVLVISETMARELFPGENPVGQKIVADFGQPATAEATGVVGDVMCNSLSDNRKWTMYGSYRQRRLSTMRLAVRTFANPTSIAGAVRDELRALDPNIPLAHIATLESWIARSTAGSRVITVLLSLFAASAMLLSAMGLYGVLAYYVVQRRHEIGVRIAIGACRRNVMTMVLCRGIWLVMLGLVIGIAASLAAGRLVRQLLFGMQPADPATFIGVGLFFTAAALMACSVPAWRATWVDPAIALQAE